MIRSFTFLFRPFPSLNCAAQLNEKLFVWSQRSAALAKHLHVSPLRFADSSDDGKEIPIDNGKLDAKSSDDGKQTPTDCDKEEPEAKLSKVLLDPQRLRMRTDQRRVVIRQAIKEQKILATGEEGGGTSGAKSLLSMNTAQIDQHLPTAMTVLQQFDGVPFRELPVVHIKATPNNTIIHAFNFITKRAILYTSCRKEGFKNVKKKSPLAGQTTGTAAGQKLLRRGISTVRVIIKGIGPGRIASVKGLAASGVKVVSISDVTPLPELGPRPKKIRRV